MSDKSPSGYKVSKRFSFSLGMNIIIGASQTGKTYLLKHIIKLTHNRYTDFWVFGRNRISLSDWVKFFESINRKAAVFYDLKDEVISEIDSIQSKEESDKRTKIMIIFDDILGSATDSKATRMRNENCFDFIAMNSRHWNAVSVVLVQDIVGISTSQINNAGTVCVFSANYQRMIQHILPKVLYSSLWQFNLEKSRPCKQKAFMIELMNTLEKYQCLVSERDGAKRKLYMYRAP